MYVSYDPGKNVWRKDITHENKKKIKHIRHVFIVPFNPKAQKHICKSILKYKLHLLNNKT